VTTWTRESAEVRLIERNVLAIVCEPGLAAEVRVIAGKCQAPEWVVADRPRYAKLMSKRSSAGDSHAKICGYLDKAEAAERKGEFVARKGIS
jgi:hypothetical protein